MSFSRDVAGIIAEYLSEYKLLDCIDKSMVCNDWLSENHNGLDFLLENKVNINVVTLGNNPSPRAVNMFIKTMLPTVQKLCFSHLLSNPTASEFIINEIKKYMEHYKLPSLNATINQLIHRFPVTFNMNELCKNTNNELFNLLEPYIYGAGNLMSVAMNPCDAAVKYIFNNLDRIRPDYLSANCNPKVVEYIIKNNLVNFHYLNYNSHPAAIELLKANTDKINWRLLSRNPAAIELLKTYIPFIKANPDIFTSKIYHSADYVLFISANPAIFELKSDQKIIDVLIQI